MAPSLFMLSLDMNSFRSKKVAQKKDSGYKNDPPPPKKKRS